MSLESVKAFIDKIESDGTLKKEIVAKMKGMSYLNEHFVLLGTEHGYSFTPHELEEVLAETATPDGDELDKVSEKNPDPHKFGGFAEFLSATIKK